MMTNQTPKYAGTIKTCWELRTYDVWGNETDGFQVNDTSEAGEIELHLAVYRYNVGTPHEFKSAAPSDRQIKRAFGVNCRIDADGDDLHVTVDRRRDGRPLGEMTCTSHESLSPVRKAEATS